MNRSGLLPLLGAVIIVGAMVGAASSVGAEIAVFTAHLSPANEVPPVSNADQSGTGLAIVKLTVVRDAGNNITSAVADFDFRLGRFPENANESIVGAHIHQGSTGLNGPIVVDSGITPNNPLPLGGGGAEVLRFGLTVSPAIAAQIIANTAGFYFNAHTSFNPGGAVRGQLANSTGLGFSIFTNQLSYTAGDLFLFELFLGNAGGTANVDVFAGLVLPSQVSSAVCPGANNLALLFLGPNSTFIQKCLADLGNPAIPGNPDFALARNINIPTSFLDEITLLGLRLPTGTPPGTYHAFFCYARPQSAPFEPVCDTQAFATVP